MKKKQSIAFEHFLEKFPEIELPVTLGADTHHTFSENNEPLPALMIQQFITNIEGEEVDEFTEYIPCFRVPDTPDFHAIVYWKASLLQYEYTLLTFTKKGAIIDKKGIAGTKAKGKVLAQSVATIDDDWIIHIVGGVASTDKDYDPTSSQMLKLELHPTGQILPMN
ncbi:MAG: hypothetical protein AAFP19_04265 [Bacteroidota bacterium]